MSRPKLFKPTRPPRSIDEPRCACGCGQPGSYGFAGNVFYAFGHWPAELKEGGRPAPERPPAPPPAAPAPRIEAGAPAQADLFGLPNPAARLTKRASALTGRDSA